MIKALRLFSAVIIFVLTSLPLSAQDITFSNVEKKSTSTNKYDYECPPFALSALPDTALLTFGAAAAITGFALTKYSDFPKWYERSYNKDSINSFDRLWYNRYSKNVDRAGDVAVALGGYILPLAVFSGQTIAGNMDSMDFLTVGVMYAETWCFTYGIKNIIKTQIRRTRPYMYTSSWESDGVKSGDFVMSFPSGHSTDAFMGAAFLTYVFSEYYPESSLRWPLVAISYSIAVGTGVLRVASGNHFMTDVLSGATLGTAIGFFVPFIHTRIAQIKYNNRQVVNFTGNTLSAKFYF